MDGPRTGEDLIRGSVFEAADRSPVQNRAEKRRRVERFWATYSGETWTMGRDGWKGHGFFHILELFLW